MIVDEVYLSDCCSSAPLGEVSAIDIKVYAIGRCSKCGENTGFILEENWDEQEEEQDY